MRMVNSASHRVDALCACRRIGRIGHAAAPALSRPCCDLRLVTSEQVVRRVLNASLGTQLFVLQMVIVFLAVGGTAGVWVEHTRDQLDHAVPAASAGDRRVRGGLPAGARGLRLRPGPELGLQPIAAGVQRATGADYVVIANREQIRYAHPTPR